MSAVTPPPVRLRGNDSRVRRVAYGVLVRAVRGRRERGGDWGEAVLAEFAETRGDWEAVRWAAGGLRAAWQERRRRLPRGVRIGRRVAGVVVAGVVLGLLVNQFVLTVGDEPSGSMEPTLLIGDRYLVDKAAYRLTGVHRGDLVVYAPTGGQAGAARVKRVLGLPGDTIECRDGRVWRDGRPVDEPYLSSGPDDNRTDCAPLTVPSHTLYLLGDHRIVSQDSRQAGPVPESAVEGRVLTRIWPPAGRP